MTWTHPAVGAAVFAFLLYIPSLGGGFLRDDHFLIERHPYLRAPGWLGQLLAADFWAPVSGATGMWRPLILFSYWLDGRLGGWTPLWFHVVNALAHALTTSALALLVAACGAGLVATWLCALAFAAMPAHVECVAWISGRTDVFCALFGVAALWLDVRARSEGRRWPGALPLLALALSLMSKEVAVPLLGVLTVSEWLRTRPPGTNAWPSVLWLLPYAGVTAIYLALHRMLAPDPGQILVHDLQSHVASRGAAWALFPGYLAFLWPWFPHSPDRAAPLMATSPGVETAIGAMGVAALAVLLVVLIWRRWRGAPAVALILFPLGPPLVLAATRGYGLYGERHMYLPSAGVVWSLALSLPALGARIGRAGGRIVAALAVIFVIGSTVETLHAFPAYHDDGAMYRAMTEHEPNNPMGFLGLAGVLTQAGRLDDAVAMLDRAERIDPGLAGADVGRAQVAQRRQAWGAMLADAERALAIDPHLQAARLERVLALMRLGRLPEAGRDLETLRAEYPGHPEVGTVWGQYLYATGHPDQALPVLLGAAELLPGDPGLWDAIGMSSVRVGRREDARAAFEHVVSITPDYLEGWMRLAAACQMLEDAPGRERALARANELPGGSPRVEAFRRVLGAR